MTQIICRAITCMYWAEGICGAEEIEYEPDVGCLAFQDLSDFELDDDGDDLDWDDDTDEDLYEDDDEKWDADDDDWDDKDLSDPVLVPGL